MASQDHKEQDNLVSKRAKTVESKDPQLCYGYGGYKEMDVQDKREKLKGAKVEEVVRHPLPGCNHPTDFSFSNGGSLLCALHSSEGTLQRALYVCNINSSQQEGRIGEEDVPTAHFDLMVEAPRGSGVDEKNISIEERLRRERLRERGLGVTRYSWPSFASKIRSDMDIEGECSTVLVPLSDGLYIQNIQVKGQKPSEIMWRKEGCLKKIISAEENKPILEPTLSPDGRKISFVKSGELYCTWIDSGNTIQLTNGARKGVVYAVAEYVAQEEMDRRSGHWWSPDSSKIAFTEVNTTHIPSYRIVHAVTKDSKVVEEEHEYPFTGKENAVVRLGVVSLENPKSILWTDIEAGSKNTFEEYLPRVSWSPDGTLWAQLQDRRQQILQLLQFNKDGKRKVIIDETTTVWHNLNNCMRHLSEKTVAGGGFIWGSERDGYRHLYLYDNSGKCLHQITSGEWMIDSIEGIDESNGRIYFTGTLQSELERHLYCLHFGQQGALGKEKKLTTALGVHHVILDPTFQVFVDIHDSPKNPPQIMLRDLKSGAPLYVIHRSKVLSSDKRLESFAASPPDLVTIKADDGTLLNGAIYKPDPEVYGPGPYKTLVSVYGGPHVQIVSNSWFMSVDMRAQFFRAKGYLVFKLDNRGSARRGLAFEGMIKGNMGSIEIVDQVCGIKWLVNQGLTDAKRVGIYGWSYGGYLSLMALSKEPNVFKAAVSGAPVTSWDGYDTHYTERYMGLMDENADGYFASSVLTHVHGIQGRLFLIHGMLDENVHFRHSVRLINALNSAAIDYDLLVLPNERHMPRQLQDRVYMEKRIYKFFEENL